MPILPQRTTGLRTSHPFLALGFMFIVGLSTLASDRVQFKTWNTENGLPQNAVNNIVQTPDGYIWLGTFDGLARFDGARFKIFKKSNTPSLPMNRIYSLLVDSAGRLWIWTEDPNTLVLYELGKFRAFLKGTDFNADDIYNCLIEEGGIRFRAGEDVYVYRDGKFDLLKAEPIKLPKVFYDADTNLIWITTNEGNYAVNKRQSKFYQKDAELPLNRRRVKESEFVEIDGAVWFLVPISDHDHRLTVFRDGHLKTSSLSLKTPKFFRADRENNFWLGDFYDGVRKIAAASVRHDDPLHLKVEHFSRANGLASNNPSTMLADKDNNIWIGTDKGLQLLIDEPVITVYSKASGLPSENIYSIVQDKAGKIWFGAWDNYLVKYLNNVLTSERNQFVQALFVDSEARLWVATSGTVYYRNSESSKWSSLDDQVRTPVSGSDKCDCYISRSKW